MAGEIQAYIKQHQHLVALPGIVAQLNRMVSDPASTIADIAKTIGKDPVLTARVLKVVNSPFFGFPSKVDNITMAITILGTRQLRDLVLATTLISNHKGGHIHNLEMESFWCHSITTGIAARALSQHLKVANNERFFTAGLLHDIGKLVIYQSTAAKTQPVSRIHSIADEKRIFDFSHNEVGAELLRQWLLPEALIEPVMNHHKLGETLQFPKECAVVHIANVIANNLHPALSEDDDTLIEPHAWKVLEISDSLLDTLHEDTYEQLDTCLNVLFYDLAA